jgi:hypothetical protein
VVADAVIDLNADLGEGFGRWTLTDDEALLSVVTSANVACGFHAGDPQIMTRVVRAALARGVAIALPLLALFGGLFLAADAVFKSFVVGAVPDLRTLWVHGLVALAFGWAAAIAIVILGLLTLTPVVPSDRYDTFLDALLLTLPLVLAGGFSWDDRTGGPLRAALWVVAFGLLLGGILSWPPVLDHLADEHRVVFVLLALSTATAARLLGRRPLLFQWLGASGD